MRFFVSNLIPKGDRSANVVEGKTFVCLKNCTIKKPESKKLRAVNSKLLMNILYPLEKIFEEL